MASTDTHDTSAIQAFWQHPFDQDPEYNEGLNSIVQSGMLEGKSPEEVEHLMLQSQLFFWNRKHQLGLALPEVLAGRPTGDSIVVSSESASIPNAAPSSTSAGESFEPELPEAGAEEPQTLTFAQLKALIEQGRTDEIPNNKHIPEVFSEDAPSVSNTSVRRKPWEVQAA